MMPKWEICQCKVADSEVVEVDSEVEEGEEEMDSVADREDREEVEVVEMAPGVAPQAVVVVQDQTKKIQSL